MGCVWDDAKRLADDGAFVGAFSGFVVAAALRWRTVLPSWRVMGEIGAAAGFTAGLGLVIGAILGAIIGGTE